MKSPLIERSSKGYAEYLRATRALAVEPFGLGSDDVPEKFKDGTVVIWRNRISRPLNAVDLEKEDMKRTKALLLLAFLLAVGGMGTKVEADAGGAPYVIQVTYKDMYWGCRYRNTYYSNGDVVSVVVSCNPGSGLNPAQ